MRGVDESSLRAVLERIAAGALTPELGVEALRDLPFSDLGYALVDHHRALRQGTPEVIFAAGKTTEQVLGIARAIVKHGDNVLITRLDAATASALAAQDGVAGFRYNAMARVGTVETKPPTIVNTAPVVLVSAGTSDMPVAEECSETMRMLGVIHERVNDVGVAGIHRLLSRRDMLMRASVVIVCAGMEGALPSAVGGLVDVPIIAVPTSIGYGAALEGFTSMMCALSSCASGVTVCNIDNGFGAAFAAFRVFRSQKRNKEQHTS